MLSAQFQPFCLSLNVLMTKICGVLLYNKPAMCSATFMAFPASFKLNVD